MKVHQFKSSQDLYESYSFKIPDKVKCHDTFFIDELFFAICIKLNNVSTTDYNLIFYSFTLKEGD